MERGTTVNEHLLPCGWLHEDRNGAVRTFRVELSLNCALATREVQRVAGSPIVPYPAVAPNQYFE